MYVWMRQWSKHLGSGSHKAKWTEAEEKVQVKLSPELYQLPWCMAGSHFKRQAWKILSFTRIAWNWLKWIVCRVVCNFVIAIFSYLFPVHFPYENISQYCYAQGSYGKSLASIPGLVCFMKMIAATTYWAFNMYWASTECWFSGIINSSSLSPPYRA